jgi:hypothetical protein
MNKKRLMLGEWHEVCGTFRGLKRDTNGITVAFDGFELFLYSESEAEIIESLLDDSLQGTRVSILRTDLIERPLLVRTEQNELDNTIAETAMQSMANIAEGEDGDG